MNEYERIGEYCIGLFSLFIYGAFESFMYYNVLCIIVNTFYDKIGFDLLNIFYRVASS